MHNFLFTYSADQGGLTGSGERFIYAVCFIYQALALIIPCSKGRIFFLVLGTYAITIKYIKTYKDD